MSSSASPRRTRTRRRTRAPVALCCGVRVHWRRLRAGTLIFPPFVTENFVEVDIIDDEAFEEDEQFYIKLKNLRELDFATGAPYCTALQCTSPMQSHCRLI